MVFALGASLGHVGRTPGAFCSSFCVFWAEIQCYSIENLKQFLCLGLFQLFLQCNLPEIAAQRKAVKSQSAIGQKMKLVGFLAQLFFLFFPFSQMMEFFPLFIALVISVQAVDFLKIVEEYAGIASFSRFLPAVLIKIIFLCMCACVSIWSCWNTCFMCFTNTWKSWRLQFFPVVSFLLFFCFSL